MLQAAASQMMALILTEFVRGAGTDCGKRAATKQGPGQAVPWSQVLGVEGQTWGWAVCWGSTDDGSGYPGTTEMRALRPVALLVDSELENLLQILACFQTPFPSAVVTSALGCWDWRPALCPATLAPGGSLWTGRQERCFLRWDQGPLVWTWAELSHNLCSWHSILHEL